MILIFYLVIGNLLLVSIWVGWVTFRDLVFGENMTYKCCSIALLKKGDLFRFLKSEKGTTYKFLHRAGQFILCEEFIFEGIEIRTTVFSIHDIPTRVILMEVDNNV